MKRIKVFALLVLVFSVTIPVRLNFVSNKTNELDECHVNMLIIMKVWEHDGAFYHKLSPCVTFANPGDKFAAYFKRLEDKKGDNYYVSYPPLIYMVTYPLVKLAGIEHAKLLMQILNILIHFLSCLLIYGIILEYFKRKPGSFFLPAFIAFMIYVFSPLMLTFHTHLYFPEMAGQFLFILTLFYTQKILNRNRQVDLFSLILVGILVLIFVYADWLGFLYVFVLALLLVFTIKQPNRKKILITVVVSATLGLLVMLIQYSLIAGLRSLTASLFMRFAERSGFFPQGYFSPGDNIYNGNTYQLYFLNFAEGLNFFGLAGIILFIFWLSSPYFFVRVQKIFRNRLAILSLFPALLSMIIFFNASATHSHYIARIIVPMSLGSGILFYKLLYEGSGIIKVVKSISMVVLIGIAIFSLVQYYQVEKTVCSLTDEKYTEKTADYITHISSKDELIFVNNKYAGYPPYMYLTLLTGRNILASESLQDAKNRIVDYPQHKAIFIEADASKDSFESIQFDNPHFHQRN